MPAEKLNRVTLNQARIFTHLVRSRAIGRPVRVKSLARELDVSPAAASQAVDRLVAYGVLSRSPDPDDRRAVRLSFTPKGDNLLRNHERRAEDLLAALGGIASEADFAVFRRVLSRLAAALSARWDGYLETKASASPSESRV
jgi:DNA-binding MarR family transcriptional regulator